MKINNRLLKFLSFGLLLVLVLVLMAGTVLEKLTDTQTVYGMIYTSPITICLWAISALAAVFYLWRRKVQNMKVTYVLHLSFVLILAGALVTHVFGKQGKFHIRQGEEAVRSYELSNGSQTEFPFSVSLEEFELEYYAGTFSPMDYVSRLTFTAQDGSVTEGKVSMNHICKYQNFRFYQSGYDRDGQGTVIAVSYDPYGIAITYAGYLCLLLSLLGFFLQKKSGFRTLLSHPVLKRMGTMCFLLLLLINAPQAMAASTQSVERPQALPKKVAEAFGDLYIYYNDRICPLQTVAKDFTVKLYGKAKYQGLSAEQVFTGWFFFYDSWKEQPMIRIKDAETRRLLGIQDEYASVKDFVDVRGYKLQEALEHDAVPGVKSANEKFNLVSMATTGGLFRIYPYRLPENPVSVWYSLADRIPRTIPTEEWVFIRNSMNYVAERVAMQDYKEVIRLVGKIKKYQEKRGDDLPSAAKFKAEKWYNSTNINRPLAMGCVALGIVAFAIFCRLFAARRKSGILNGILMAVMGLVSLYLAVHLCLRGYISGHLPMSDGFETMLFMAWCTTVFTLVFQRKFMMALPFGFLICGLSMMVAMFGESNPKVTNLMPVLQSPLLSIHVVVIMLAYSLLAFTMLDGVTALFFHFSRKDHSEEIEYLAVMSRIMLYPAVFLLTIGIFIGAVWANVSWGRYWGWDPKEVWALITMLVYALSLHPGSLPWFRKPIFFHVFCVLAFLCVLITYFGVNFFLGGMHSYA